MLKNKISVKPTSRQNNDKPINQSHFKELTPPPPPVYCILKADKWVKE